MGGGSDVEVPGPSDSEIRLQEEQVSILRQQRDLAAQQARLASAILPATLRTAGLRPVTDEAGQITGVEEIPLSPEEQELQDIRAGIELGFLKRSQAALAGELPVSPALLQELDEAEAEQRERLRKQGLDPGDTPYEQAMGQFLQRRENVLEGARRGDLTLAEQLGQARESTNLNRESEVLRRMLVGGGSLNPAVSALGATAGSYNAPLNLFAQNRQLGFQANLANAQRTDPLGSILGGIAGVGFGGFAGGFGSGYGQSIFGQRLPPIASVYRR